MISFLNDISLEVDLCQSVYLCPSVGHHRHHLFVSPSNLVDYCVQVNKFLDRRITHIMEIAFVSYSHPMMSTCQDFQIYSFQINDNKPNLPAVMLHFKYSHKSCHLSGSHKYTYRVCSIKA